MWIESNYRLGIGVTLSSASSLKRQGLAEDDSNNISSFMLPIHASCLLSKDSFPVGTEVKVMISHRRAPVTKHNGVVDVFPGELHHGIGLVRSCVKHSIFSDRSIIEFDVKVRGGISDDDRQKNWSVVYVNGEKLVVDYEKEQA